MKGKEPSTSLVDALIDKVCWECQLLVNHFTIFERIVYLCIRHRTRVEPYVDKVGLSLHRLAAWRYEYYPVHIRTMQIYLVVVSLTHVTRYKSIIFQRI